MLMLFLKSLKHSEVVIAAKFDFLAYQLNDWEVFSC